MRSPSDIFCIRSSYGSCFSIFIAFDRLMCVCMPIRYYKLNTKLYLSSIVLLVSERQVLCSLVDCLAPEAPVFTLMWLLSTCVLYAIISFILKTSANKADKTTKRIFKSLLAIFIACFIPWFSTAIALHITGSMALSLIDQWHIRVVFNHGVIFASVADAPILFWFR
uniref:Uncharacterized protein n=1 Tax=Ditylenchus dipsaci TaxID=166011 RepID=A0A915EPU7_9BILA